MFQFNGKNGTALDRLNLNANLMPVRGRSTMLGAKSRLGSGIESHFLGLDTLFPVGMQSHPNELSWQKGLLIQPI